VSNILTAIGISYQSTRCSTARSLGHRRLRGQTKASPAWLDFLADIDDSSCSQVSGPTVNDGPWRETVTALRADDCASPNMRKSSDTRNMIIRYTMSQINIISCSSDSALRYRYLLRLARDWTEARLPLFNRPPRSLLYRQYSGQSTLRPEAQGTKRFERLVKRKNVLDRGVWSTKRAFDGSRFSTPLSQPTFLFSSFRRNSPPSHARSCTGCRATPPSHPWIAWGAIPNSRPVLVS